MRSVSSPPWKFAQLTCETSGYDFNSRHAGEAIRARVRRRLQRDPRLHPCVRHEGRGRQRTNLSGTSESRIETAHKG